MKYQNIRTEKKKGCGRKGISLLMAGTMAVSMLPAVPANAAELAEADICSSGTGRQRKGGVRIIGESAGRGE